jgi:hypothetical protein
MNSAPEEFEALKQLLSLKRHEEPPPGYFDQLPRRIQARIQAGVPETRSGFWEKFLEGFHLRPSVAYSVAGVIFVGMTAGLAILTSTGPDQGVSGPYDPPMAREGTWEAPPGTPVAFPLANSVQTPTNPAASSLTPSVPALEAIRVNFGVK